MKKVFYLALFCLLVSGCGKDKPEYVNVIEQDYISLEQNDIPVFSKVMLSDIIKVEDGVTLVTEDFLIDTNKVGKQDIEVKFEVDDKKYLYKDKIEIKDTEPPFVFSDTYKYVSLGYTGNLCDLILYGDNYSGEVRCDIEGTYDLNTPGEYTLNYKLSDENENVTNESVTINVIDPNASSGDEDDSYYTSEPTYFTDVYNKFKNDNTEIGVDISEWQENVDFNKVKNAGASFVILRIALQGTESRNLYEDVTFKEYIKLAKKAGLKVGVYFYTVATSKKEAKSQAEYVLDLLDGEKLDLPIVFDWENWVDWNSYKISFHELDQIANTFIKRVEKDGYVGMLYGSKYYLENIWENSEEAPVWLAHYTDQTSYKGEYDIWQLCNDGVIDGINGYADFNVLYKK